MRRRPPVRILTLLCVAWILVFAEIGNAAPTSCPVVVDTSKCELVVGETRVVVAASDTGSGSFVIDAWEIGGVRQLAPGFSGLAFRDFSTSSQLPVSAQLEVATVDVEASTISIGFRELVSGQPGPFSLSVDFHVSHDGDTSALARTITVRNDGTTSVVSRVYDVMDLDLGGTAMDESAFVIPNGPTIYQSDGATLAETNIDSGPAADGYEIALCPPCDLSNLLGDATFDLLNITSVAGPGDFQSALSWNQKLAPAESFNVTLETSIVPEPESGVCALGAVLTLLSCKRASNRTASAHSAPSHRKRLEVRAGPESPRRGSASHGGHRG